MVCMLRCLKGVEDDERVEVRRRFLVLRVVVEGGLVRWWRRYGGLVVGVCKKKLS